MEPNLPPDMSDDPAPHRAMRVPDPVHPAEPGQSKDILQHYVSRDESQDTSAQFKIPTGKDLEAEARSWSLPFKSKRMVAALLTTVARDRLEDLKYIVAPDARWGKPDSRMMGARRVFAGDGGEAFFRALRQAATRFPHPPNYTNATAFELGVQERLRTGAEPMWAYYENGLDRILFRFRVIGGHAWIDYIGLFEDPPATAIHVSDKGPPPPMSPPVRLPNGSIVPTRSGAGADKTVRRPVNPQ
jgi:hypothetical protein